MGILSLVRHGQASFMKADYDQLSALGFEQGRMLGRWWASRGVEFDLVAAGPMLRHRQTCEAAAEGLGRPWPQVRELAGLAEYDATALFKVGLPVLLAAHPALQADVERYRAGGPEASRSFQRVLEALGRAWAQGEIEGPGLEPWADFRARVEGAVRSLMEEAGRGQRVVAFTSGGPIGAAVGMALELGEVKALELSWQVYNGAEARFFFSGDRLTLSAFNEAGHLTPEALTWR